MSARMLERDAIRGEPIVIEDVEVVPEVRRWLLRLPGSHGGLIWSRPSALLVRGQDGTERRLPIIDWTRIGQIGLLGLALVVAAAFWRIGASGAVVNEEEPA